MGVMATLFDEITVRCRWLTLDYVPYEPSILRDLKNGRFVDSVVLNLGSGGTNLQRGAINLDSTLFPFVNVLGDGLCLPLRSLSVDVVVLLEVLEHVRDSRALVHEVSRVLKPGGVVYCAVPFVAAYHAWPSDYYRFSLEGLDEVFGGFECLKKGVLRGPSVTLINSLGHISPLHWAHLMAQGSAY